MMSAGRARDMGGFVLSRVNEHPRRLRERPGLLRAVQGAAANVGVSRTSGGTWLWNSHRLTWLLDDCVVKVARSRYGATALRHDRDVRRRIHTDPVGAGWRDVVSRTYWSGEVEGRFTVVEERLPGRSHAVTWSGEGPDRAALQECAERQAATAHWIVADDTRLMAWLRAPAANVSGLLRHWGRPGEGLAVSRWAARTAGQLRDNPFCAVLVHGDLWPGNVLAGDTGAAVTGVVDWDQAAFHDAAVHDALHMILYPASRARRRDLGLVIREALVSQTSEGDIRTALRRWEAAGDCRESGMSNRDALTWYWLRHVSRMADEPGHANNPRWVRNNVLAVASILYEGKS